MTKTAPTKIVYGEAQYPSWLELSPFRTSGWFPVAWVLGPLAWREWVSLCCLGEAWLARFINRISGIRVDMLHTSKDTCPVTSPWKESALD